jgi:hypothetical protein
MEGWERHNSAAAERVEAVKNSPEYRAGTKAFYDAHAFIIPCTVKEVIEEGNGVYVSTGRLKIVVDRGCGPYKKGDEMTVSAYHTFPRSHRVKRGHGYRINCLYRWVR